jgi:hypothetical protein
VTTRDVGREPAANRASNVVSARLSASSAISMATRALSNVDAAFEYSSR